MSRVIRVKYTGAQSPQFDAIRRALAESQNAATGDDVERTLARIAIITRNARKGAPAPVFDFEKQRMAVQRK